MDVPMQQDNPEILADIARHFRDYFDLAERKRRWSIRDDVPWDQCNGSLNPAVADIVETFCAVELYLPDYLSKLIPQVRANRGRAWMLANWGYEECKHSMVLEDWLLHSHMRSEEQVADMHQEVFAQEWDLPYDNARAMVVYTMLQELATQLHYVQSARGGGPRGRLSRPGEGAYCWWPWTRRPTPTSSADSWASIFATTDRAPWSRSAAWSTHSACPPSTCWPAP